MKSIIFNEAGSWSQKLLLTKTDIGDPLEDEVQVQVMARPVNPSDKMFIMGNYRQKPVFPQIAGLEGAGVICKIGKSIDSSLLGKHVSFRSKGTWAENINVSLKNCRIVPAKLSFETACQISLNSLTAYALLERSGLIAGQWLLLTAANSSVCKQIIQLAKTRGLKIISLVRQDIYKKELFDIGSDMVLNSETENLEQQIADNTEEGANAILDAVGGSLGTRILNLAAPFCQIIIYGRLSSEASSFSNGTLIYKNLRIEGFGIDHWIAEKSEKEMDLIWNQLLEAILQGKLRLAYDRSYSLQDFGTAIAHYEESGGKIILK